MSNATLHPIAAMSLDTTTERLVLERAMEHALAYLESLDTASVRTTVPLAELRRRFAIPLEAEGVDPATVIDELARDTAGGLLGSAGGRFYGWVIGGGLPAAVGADWLTSVWDQNAGLYACGPAAAVVEEVCGAWLKDLLGLPATASFALVTGCQMAHVTCLAAARHALLARRGWDVNQHGLAGSPAIRILTSDHVHGTTTRAIRFLGLGTGNITVLETDPDSRLNPAVLARALAAAPDQPTIVVLQAGDVNTGAFDAFPELIALAHRAGAWVHVDGAMGSGATRRPGSATSSLAWSRRTPGPPTATNGSTFPTTRGTPSWPIPSITAPGWSIARATWYTPTMSGTSSTGRRSIPAGPAGSPPGPRSGSWGAPAWRTWSSAVPGMPARW